jgi:DNA-directed RNA polymerase subunit K/omega
VIYHPVETNMFTAVVVATLRAKQLMRGCTPRVPSGLKFTTTARREVAAAKVSFAVTEHVNGRPTAAATGGFDVRPI